jgi:outer membrane receptor protein involved in Fe transport
MRASRLPDLTTAIGLALVTTVACAGLTTAPTASADAAAAAPSAPASADKPPVDESEVRLLAQAGDASGDEDKPVLEEVVVTGSQIRGGNIGGALAITVIDAEAIAEFGFETGDQLLDAIPEQGQNFFNEAENISGGVNSARGDIGAFNLRNIGTGNTLVLFNGRRMVNSATFQTEEVGGSFVPVNTANAAAIPLFGVDRVEVLRDGASAIYGADAVAGVVNTIMRDDYDGFSIRGRYTDYDNIPRKTYNATIEWGTMFNGGRTAVGVFANFYHRDRVNSQDDPKWADSDYRRFLSEDSPWFGDTRFRNNSANSLWGQFDIVESMRGDPYGLVARGIVDRSGEFETYPAGEERCAYDIAENHCGAPDGQGVFRYNLNDNRDLSSELDRYNLYGYFNHEFDNGLEFYSEVNYYKSETNLIRHPTAPFTSVRLRVGAENYYNPFGPCGSPNRLPEELIGPDVPCEGLELIIDNYRFAEVPRIVDNDGEMIRLLGGLRGTFGTDWNWDSAILWNRSEKNEVTRNRPANSLLAEALFDPTPDAYNPFAGGGARPSNIERVLVDVTRDSEAELTLIDFKLSNPVLFDIWSGPVAFGAGVEYREESFFDDRDPRLDGTIQFTDYDGDTYPFVSDVVNSSPTPDNSGSRDVFSAYGEFIIPLHSTFDLQLALRYEDFSDVGNTTVPKVAFNWRPLDWLAFRGSWSEAFRAPNLITVNEDIVVRNNTRTDWACTYAADFGGDPEQDIIDCRNNIQRRASGSEDLRPEKSDNMSVGFILTPTDSLTLTVDFWQIEKQDTIGLFGEENHSLLDLLLRLEAGTSDCANFQGNPAVSRIAPDEDQAAIYLAAGICPGGDIDFVADQYANLDTRKVEGFDIAAYYDLDTRYGLWSFTYQGSFYTRYDQDPGELAGRLLAAQDAGVLPANYPVDGLGDLIRRDGNQEEKMNARVRWRYNDWGAALSWFYLGDFYQDSLTLSDGTQWVIPSHDFFNASVDYRFDIGNVETLLRFGINNVTDERAPLADRFFGFFADAHRDYGRSYFLDARFDF